MNVIKIAKDFRKGIATRFPRVSYPSVYTIGVAIQRSRIKRRVSPRLLWRDWVGGIEVTEITCTSEKSLHSN